MSELVSSSNSTKNNEGNSTPSVDAAHGRGDRQTYYKKWDNFAEEEDARIKAEEEEAKKREDELKNKGPVSEVQKKDMEKREALKEAKKHWDNVQRGEESMKAVISDEKSILDRKVFTDDMGQRQVLVLKNNEDCVYDIPVENKLIKFFIDDCKRCVINLHCSLKTSFVEISHCEDVKLVISTHPAHTVQVDISKNIQIFYHRGTFSDDSKCYHASVSNMKVEYDILGTGTDTKIQELDDFELAELNPHIAPHEQQFVTAVVDGELVTDFVMRDARGHPTTQREVDVRRAQLEEAAQKRGVDINDPIVQKTLREYEPVSITQRGKVFKDEGNAAFKEKDYRQAAVHYSQAIAAFESLLGEKEEEAIELMITCLTNRAFCSAKLGEHDNALTDAEAALKMKPVHVKALFRKGVALHALNRWREACVVLSQALDLKPGDKDIKTALTFAERKAALAARG